MAFKWLIDGENVGVRILKPFWIQLGVTHVDFDFSSPSQTAFLLKANLPARSPSDISLKICTLPTWFSYFRPLKCYKKSYYVKTGLQIMHCHYGSWFIISPYFFFWLRMISSNLRRSLEMSRNITQSQPISWERSKLSLTACSDILRNKKHTWWAPWNFLSFQSASNERIINQHSKTNSHDLGGRSLHTASQDILVP